MQGVNTTPSQSSSISLPSVRKKERLSTTLGKDFLSVMGDIEKSHALSLSVNEEHSFTSQNYPIGIYQSMTEEIIPSGTFFKPGSKSLWDDQQFASLISKGENIDTTKSINWESNGEEKLTQNQIAQLKKKYDVTNLSSQEYYDLMSDLTHMGVLSAEDCIGVNMVYTNEKPPAVRFIPYPFKPLSLYSKEICPTSGNLIKSLSTALDILREQLELINSDEYMRVNTITEEDRELDRAAMEKNIHTRQTMLDVLTQLQ